MDDKLVLLFERDIEPELGAFNPNISDNNSTYIYPLNI